MCGRIAATILVILSLGLTGFAADYPSKNLPADEIHPRMTSSLQLLSRAAQGGDVSPEALTPSARESIRTGVVTFIVEPSRGNVGAVDVQAIRMLGGEVEAISDSLLRVRAPADRLEAIAEEVSGIAFLREPFPAAPMAVTSQGVGLTGAGDFHSAGHDGVGVRVAIIDLGFSGLSLAQASGELVNVVYTRDYTGLGLETGESHGTGVAEVVEDMAPGASLYLMKISDSVDLQNAVSDCLAEGVDVINHSVGWYSSNYYDGTGVIAGIANNARANGILWVNSAGNEAADGHWQSAFYGVFPDSDGDGLLNFAAGGSDFLDSDGWDEGNRVDLSWDDTLVVYMTWDDWTASDQDYDLYLYNSAGEAVASSTNWQSGFQAPTETITYTPSDDTQHTYTDGDYEIVIHAYDAPDAPDIEFYAFRTSSANTNLEVHDPSSTIVTPGNSDQVLTVGAIRWTNWTTGPQEAFSSRGPSNESQYQPARTKPDIAGPDGVSNWTYSFFYGTSASSPHVAGAAALLLGEDPSRTANDLQTLLEVSAIDMGGAGKDNVYGAGRLNLVLSAPPPSPPAQVTDFAASDGEDGQSALTWTNPADADLAQVVVQRTIGAHPADHADGVTVYDNESPAPGSAVSTVDSGLTNGMTYFYAVFSRDADGSWNETVTEGLNADTANPAGSLPPPDAPAGYWQFNEGAGTTAADSSGNGNDGTIIGASWTTSTDGSGALLFDGVGDYVTVPETASLNITGSAITVEAWIRREEDSGTYEMILGKEANSGGFDIAYYMEVTRRDQAQFGFATAADAYVSVTSATSIPVGVWTHVAGLYDGSEMRIYVDGVLEGSRSQTGALYGTSGTGADPLNIGRLRFLNRYYYSGRMQIDEVRIHDRALAPADFNLIPSGPPPPPPSPPAEVDDFAASDGEDGQSTLTWTNPSDSDLAQVVVQRAIGAYPADHTDGVTVYDNATPVPGSAVSTVDSGLTNGTTYSYAVFSRDADGSWNDTVTEGANADTASPVTPVPSPPAQVTDFAASDGEDAQSTLTWTNPADADLGQVVVQRTVGAYPADHTDGVTVYDNESPAPGGAVSSVDSGLTNGTTYSYAVFSRDADGSWNETVTEGLNADAAGPVGPTPPPSDAAGYWQFNEGAGTTAGDSSGNGNDGTIVGASWTTSADGSGALSFDGVNDYVSVPETASLNITGSAITVEAWIRREEDSGTYEMILGKEANNSGYDIAYYMEVTRLDKAQFGFATSTNAYVSVTSAASVPVGTWTHVAGVYDGSEMRIYVDGVLEGSRSQTGNLYGTSGGGADPLNIGRLRFLDRYYSSGRMEIDEVRIHDRALASADFNLIPSGPPPPPPSPPAQVDDFAASDGEDGQSTLTWTNPSDADLAQVVVQRTTGGYPADHTDGVTVYDHASPVPGSAVSTVDSGLTNGTIYSYAVFSRDADGSWNETVTEGLNADTANPTGSTPPPDAPVGYWQFDEGAGTTAADSSGNGNDGTIVGASWTTSADGSGALSFDGVDDYVSVPETASLNITGSAITIEAWIRREEDSGTYEMILGKEANSSGDDIAYYMEVTRSDKAQFGFAISPSAYVSVTSATSIPVGTWTHVAGVYDGSEMRIYVDGVLEGSRSQTGNLYGTSGSGSDPLNIGRLRFRDRYYYSGRMEIDEVRIHDRALAPADFGLISAGLRPSHTLDQPQTAPRVYAAPNPAVESPVRFRADGNSVEAVSVDVYSLDGQPVFSSGWEAGDSTEWDLRTDLGEHPANGAYVCVIHVRDALRESVHRTILFIAR